MGRWYLNFSQIFGIFLLFVHNVHILHVCGIWMQLNGYNKCIYNFTKQRDKLNEMYLHPPLVWGYSYSCWTSLKAETKWPSLQTTFWSTFMWMKSSNIDQYFTTFCFYGLIDNKSALVQCDGLVSTRRQAIISTNYVLIFSLGELLLTTRIYNN